MYSERHLKQSEQLQLLLLDRIYARTGSERLVFQGGTALRWIHGGTRFSEDLDFVTWLPMQTIAARFADLAQRMLPACIAQFGPGIAELKPKPSRLNAYRAFFIFRPQNQRRRIAIKLECEQLVKGARLDVGRYVLRDLPQVPGLIAAGELVLPYSSSIIVSETPEEILSDKVRALFERRYIKGRDVYDLWWLSSQMGVRTSWAKVKNKLESYQAPFTAARTTDYFQDAAIADEICEALQVDLERFVPPAVIGIYREQNFAPFLDTLRRATAELLEQGMSFFHGTSS
jgi:predicted nucleotidyltransferase component of viral defense system